MTGATSRVADAPTWLTDFFAKVDALDTEAVLAGFAPEATMRYGSGDPTAGHDAIRAVLIALFTHYRRIEHEFLNLWICESTLLLEVAVTYGCPDGRDVTIPALTIIEHRDGLIDAMRIFIDPTSVQPG
ncbi:nuclear transport factor 2 family protein [Pseudonocardia alaniniphila]|uniref:Nuclear transport factor 2 family protein n=1 Tax=Pseudonocardia alaniniphila TaxID=75291 RepID=A0ABS9TUU6_9PSEU|nr:nuclear transport factor 2 family protein [Pseudonocardia alaniniphila]MCH6171996.1 nuclear transport factor 2 family protein [Pseudonocardia alaniniphila]